MRSDKYERYKMNESIVHHCIHSKREMEEEQVNKQARNMTIPIKTRQSNQ